MAEELILSDEGVAGLLQERRAKMSKANARELMDGVLFSNRQAMSSGTVTDEMVEAAARALYERTFEPGKGATPWGKARDLWRDQYRASARTMLEAALSAEGNDA